ncbi:HPr family phosphocarrier protein [Anaerosacchariphilus polymeriproducens]|uniref:HPr family phosphocarrier protein n=1 Tax=Anaerosacchariphilus polymeriproducens TaxID=1812858 RepID=A0A371AW86_9FIRM|nr:HPr family phosphocarrier protein [Anaerosacchariphilus polymeriproducens]RDU23836.1 HPr family phosphocarrier protein [Anaerosacchariphilus polymeriproducens]
MKSFTYKIKDMQGIHARPAGQLAKEAARYASTITLKKGENEVDVRKLIAVMGLCIKKDETITVIVEGEDEKDALKDIREFFEQNL